MVINDILKKLEVLKAKQFELRKYVLINDISRDEHYSKLHLLQDVNFEIQLIKANLTDEDTKTYLASLVEIKSYGGIGL